MRGLIAAAAIWLAGLQSAYSQAIVRSGEHADFSRLVIYMPDSQGWELVRSEAGYRLVLESWNAGFDTRSIFERMPRTRVTGIVARSAELEIAIGCNCSIISEPILGVGLIVDISDVPPPQEEVAELAPLEPAPNLPIPSIELPAIERTALLDVAEPAQDNPNPELEAFRKSLFEGLGRSASLSLVDVDALETLAPGVAADLADVVEDGRVRVTTAVEDAAKQNPPLPAPLDARVCPGADQFAIHEWGTDESFSAQIAAARLEVIEEFDTANPNKVRALAKLYLYFGMGAEARALLMQFDVPSNGENDIILSIAHILEPGLTDPGNAMLELAGCSADVAPWSVLAHSKGGAISEQQAVDTVAHFSRWPRHLQRYLGPKLISVLTSNNRVESAQIIKSTLERQGETLPHAIKIVEAENSVDPSKSMPDLLEIVFSGEDEAAAALAIYMDRSLEQGIALDMELIELAAAFADEMRGMELSNELINHRFEALAAMGHVSVAIEASNLAASRGWFPDAKLADAIIDHLLRRGDSAGAAKFALFLTSDENPFQVSSASLNTLSEALLEVGLPMVAEKVFRFESSSRQPTRMGAELAIALGALDEGTAILNEMGDERRQIDLLLRQGQAAEAWNDFGSQLPEDQAAELAWFAQRWESVEQNGIKGRIASLLHRAPDADPNVAPLAAARETSEDSQLTRSAIQELLQDADF